MDEEGEFSCTQLNRPAAEVEHNNNTHGSAKVS